MGRFWFPGSQPITFHRGASALLILLFISSALASQRQGVTFAVSIDSFSTGGGRSVSASYQQIDCAIGQESLCGPASNADYREQAGIIQAWTVSRLAAGDWTLYE